MVQEARMYLKKHIYEAPTYEQLSERAGVSPRIFPP